MLGVLVLAVGMVVTVDRIWGHSSLAFALGIVLLVIANAPMLRFNCPSCGKNAFFRGIFVVPWPNRSCTRCGADLDRADPAAR